jgi:hypothetical protein
VVAHATPGLDRSVHPIGYYVQCGAMADLAGIRRWHLPPGATSQAYAQYPPHDIRRTLSALARRNAEEVPGSRMSLLVPQSIGRTIRFAGLLTRRSTLEPAAVLTRRDPQSSDERTTH